MTELFTKISLGSAETMFFSPELFGLQSWCCGGSAEGAVSSEPFLKQYHACLWPELCREPSP